MVPPPVSSSCNNRFSRRESLGSSDNSTIATISRRGSCTACCPPSMHRNVSGHVELPPLPQPNWNRMSLISSTTHVPERSPVLPRRRSSCGSGKSSGYTSSASTSTNIQNNSNFNNSVSSPTMPRRRSSGGSGSYYSAGNTSNNSMYLKRDVVNSALPPVYTASYSSLPEVDDDGFGEEEMEELQDEDEKCHGIAGIREENTPYRQLPSFGLSCSNRSTTTSPTTASTIHDDATADEEDAFATTTTTCSRRSSTLSLPCMPLRRASVVCSDNSV